MAHLKNLKANILGMNKVIKQINPEVLEVDHGDEFEYKDPMDGLVSTHQAIRFPFKDRSRLIFRLLGTGSVRATIRVHIKQYESDSTETKKEASKLDSTKTDKDASKVDSTKSDKDVAEALAPCIVVALKLANIEKFIGCRSPTIIK